MEIEQRLRAPSTRRAVVKTGARLAYAAPLVAATMTVTGRKTGATFTIADCPCGASAPFGAPPEVIAFLQPHVCTTPRKRKKNGTLVPCIEASFLELLKSGCICCPEGSLTIPTKTQVVAWLQGCMNGFVGFCDAGPVVYGTCPDDSCLSP